MSEIIKRPGMDIGCTDWIEGLGYSVHRYILPDGQVNVGLADHLGAHHAGESMVELDDRDEWWLNKSTLGAEFVVAGTHDYSSFLTKIRGAPGEAYTDEQYFSGGYVYAGWGLEYGFGFEQIWPHSLVSGDLVRGPGKGKRDPGVAFDWMKFENWFDRWTAKLKG